jgi:TolB-like protein
VARRPASGLNERRVAVAVMANYTGDASLDNLGHMAADWVTQGLAQTGLVEVVPSTSVMTASVAGQLDATKIRLLGRETGAGTVVSGGYYRQRDSVRFQIQISAAADGKVLRALEPVAASLSEPLDAVEIVRQRVMAALATLFDSRLSRWATTASQPPNFQAYQEFIAGLDRFVQFDPHGAIRHFERAAAVDTTFWLPLIFAANSHMNVGAFAAAESLAHVVQRHADRLAPLDRSYLAWVLATCRGDRAEAFRASREMVSLAPGSEAVYLLAEDAMALNRPRDAVNALLALGPDGGFTRGWWVYWSDLTSALHMLGDHRRELKEALEGARRFPGIPQMVSVQLRALAALGRTEDVARLLTASVDLPHELGWTPADVMLEAAAELRAHGHGPAAGAALNQARQWLAARLPAEAASPAHRYRSALVAYAAGRLDEAQREFELLAGNGAAGRSASPHAVAEGLDEVDYLGHLGAIAARKGNREQALRLERALAGLTRPYLFGRHTMWRARIQALLDEREVAVGLVREAVIRGYPHTHALHTDLDFEALRGYAPFRTLLKPAE